MGVDGGMQKTLKNIICTCFPYHLYSYFYVFTGQFHLSKMHMNLNTSKTNDLAPSFFCLLWIYFFSFCLYFSTRKIPGPVPPFTSIHFILTLKRIGGSAPGRENAELDQMAILCLTFLWTVKLFSIPSTLLYISPNVQDFQLLHILASVWYLLFFTLFYNSHPNRCEVISSYGFGLHFWMISDLEHVSWTYQ